MAMPQTKVSHVANVLDLIRTEGPITRADIIDRTGLSRSTVNHHLASLSGAALIAESAPAESTGGRPSSRFVFDPSRATVLAIDIGATGLETALCDLDGTVLAHASAQIEVWEGPEKVLSAAWKVARSLFGAEGQVPVMVAVGVPGPVEHAARRVVNPPIMTGWDGFDIVAWWTARIPSASVIVENDANARAVAEARASGLDNLIAIKLGTGIGAGLYFNGQIIRGDKGDAGDVGHTRAVSLGEVPTVCRCGNEDCVEALAGGWAIRRDLEATGRTVKSTADIVELVRARDHEAVRLMRVAARRIGDSIAALVGILNPRAIVLSGRLVDSADLLLSGIYERVHQQNGAISTGDLSITVSGLGDLAGVTGLAHLAADQLLSPDQLAALVESGAPAAAAED